MTRLDELMNTMVLYKDQETLVKDLPLEAQVDFLIQTDFKYFASEEMRLWRLEHLYYLMDKNSQKVLFKLNKAQAHFFKNYLIQYLRIIILKSRQLGFTTLVALFYLDDIIFSPNKEALQIAHLLEAAKDIFNRKIKYALANLCPAMKQLLETNTKRANRVEFSYPDGSVSAISVATSGVSGTYHDLHISELAPLAQQFPEKANAVMTGTLPAVPMNGRVIIESTARGQNSIFYEMYMKSYKRKDIITPQMTKAEFFPVFYNWTWDEEEIQKACADGLIEVGLMEECEIDWADFQLTHDLTPEQMTYYYIKWIQSNRDVDKLNQEYPIDVHTAFISSGSNFYSLKKINDFYALLDDSKWLRYDFLNNSLHFNSKGDLWIKEEPTPGRYYVIGADVAQGLITGDYSTFFVLGADKRICAFYQGHMEPDDFAKLIAFMGKKYNNALLAVESNMDGNWVNTQLTNLSYPNVYLRTAFDDITKTVTRSYGWRTDSNTRKFILDASKVYFNSLKELNCRPLLEEMTVFIRNKRSKPEAAQGKHDDLVMAWAISVGVLDNVKDTIKETIKKPSLMEMIYY